MLLQAGQLNGIIFVMAPTNPIERYLSAGLAFTQLTRKRAEEMEVEVEKLDKKKKKKSKE